jgi:hypothetical protein
MRFFLLLISVGFASQVLAQTFPYTIHIDSIRIPELGGLQSYAFGQHDGKWLIIGGRLDGLHRRQPWASFDIAGHNNQILVIDPINGKTWKTSIDGFDGALKEQLSSTNMQFFQKGDQLYLSGGYGFSPTKDDHITYPYLTTIDVPKTIDAIIAKEKITPFFKQVYDEQMALCGGQMNLMDGVLCITGGHRFDGRYHPMNNSTFEQVYSSEVRRFKIDPLIGEIVWLEPIKEGEVLRRRDFNVLSSIDGQEKEGLVAFSGVFRKNVDMPYLDAVTVNSQGLKQVPGFAQYYNHYHCANVSFFDSEEKSMHYLFFGGIAQYYDSLGKLVADNDIPFTPAISRVYKDANEQFSEWKEKTVLPGYLGAASEFIVNPSLSAMENEVILLQDLQGERILLGYIYGGIHSSAANIFWINTGRESKATEWIYPVYLVQDKNGSGAAKNEQSTNGLQLQVYPKPLEKKILVLFNSESTRDVEIVLKSTEDQVLKKYKLKMVQKGSNARTLKFKPLKRGTPLKLELIEKDGITAEQILIIN